MAYLITLPPSCIKALDWIGDRYSYANTLRSCIVPTETPDVYHLEEHEAWGLYDDIENEGGLLPCAGPELEDAIVQLLEEIV